MYTDEEYINYGENESESLLWRKTRVSQEGLDGREDGRFWVI